MLWAMGAKIGDKYKTLRIERDYPLSKLTTFGIGGPADYLVFCHSDSEIAAAIDFSKDHGFDVFILGGGSNILAADKGFRGLVIVNQIKTFKLEGKMLTCGAGCLLDDIVSQTVKAGLAGMEALAGIAGTIGGAIVGNAGAYGKSISDCLCEVRLFDQRDGFYSLPKDQLGFAYRSSNLKQTGKVIIDACFKLEPGDLTKLQDEAERILKLRRQKLPPESISAGCFFKNIESKNSPHGKLAAGYLLERIGAKKMKIGKAAVFPGHANILVNQGGATAGEILKLSEKLKAKVKKQFDVELSEEVILLGDFG